MRLLSKKTARAAAVGGVILAAMGSTVAYAGTSSTELSNGRLSFEAFNGREASLPASKFYSATQYKKTGGGTVTVVFGMTTESILVKSPAKTVKKGQKVGHSWGGRSVADTGDCSATGFMKSDGSTYYTPPVNRLC
ncbi:hypothetical protein ACWC9R_06370 [Streptomyces sp. NPDC001219]